MSQVKVSDMIKKKKIAKENEFEVSAESSPSFGPRTHDVLIQNSCKEGRKDTVTFVRDDTITDLFEYLG